MSGTVTGQTSTITVKIANSRERAEVLHLRGLFYTLDYGHPGIDMFDKTAVHLVSIVDGEIIAGARILGPLPLPVELEPILRSLSVSTGQRLFQIGSLWVAPRFRRIRSDSAPASLPLMEKIISLANSMQVSGVVLRTAGAQREKYYQLVGFQKLPNCDFDDPVWGRVGLMYLNVPECRLPWGTRRRTALRGGLTEHATNKAEDC